MTKKITIATHDGKFHTDDVFAVATLSLVLKDREIEIVRTRDQALLKRADIVVDVGEEYDPARGRFDHHQKGYAGNRSNNILYASFGLVWKEYGIQLAGSEENAQWIDEHLVQDIDAHDNGQVESDKTSSGYSIGAIITSFRPALHENKPLDEGFLDALNIAVQILERLILHTKGYAESKQLITDAYNRAIDKRVVELQEELPGWKEILSAFPEPCFVTYKRNDGQWSAKCVPTEAQAFTSRRAFPEAWAGLRGEALQTISGEHSAVFCHNSRFIVVAQTREGILRLVEKALEE